MNRKLTNKEISDNIKKILLDHVMLSDGSFLDSISDLDETWLVQDLGLDSLDIVEIVIGIEDRFGVNISDDYVYSTCSYEMTLKELIDKLTKFLSTNEYCFNEEFLN